MMRLTPFSLPNVRMVISQPPEVSQESLAGHRHRLGVLPPLLSLDPFVTLTRGPEAPFQRNLLSSDTTYAQYVPGADEGPSPLFSGEPALRTPCFQ